METSGSKPAKKPRKPVRAYSGARRSYTKRSPNKSKRTPSPKKAVNKDTSPEIHASPAKRPFERPKSPLNLADALETTRSSFSDEPVNLMTGSSNSSTALFSQVSQESTQSAEGDVEKSSGSIVLSAAQQRENRLKFQRQRALKAVGKYNAQLNQRRNTERKYYYDLQTNIYHVPRREVNVLPPCPELLEMKRTMLSHQNGSNFADPVTSQQNNGSSVGAYPATLTVSPPQFSDSVPVLSGRALGYFPLRTAVNSLPPSAAQYLHMTTDAYRKRKLELNGDAANSSDDECSLFDEDEKKEEEPSVVTVPAESETLAVKNESPSVILELLNKPPPQSPAPSTNNKKAKKEKGKSNRTKTSQAEVQPTPVTVMMDSMSDAHDRLILQDVYDADSDLPPPDSCYVCHVKDKVPPSSGSEAPVEPTASDKIKKESETEVAVIDGAHDVLKKKKGKANVQDVPTLSKQPLLSCTKCKKKYHPNCVNLPKQTLLCMKKYPWECSECKNCHKCKSSAKEDKMMFCDLCDRGYHSFCVGVPKVPSGRWLCEQCAICSVCGSTRANEEGKRGRAMIWQLEWDEDDEGNVTDVRTLCYPCFDSRRKPRRKSSASNTAAVQEHNEDSTDANAEPAAAELPAEVSPED